MTVWRLVSEKDKYGVVIQNFQNHNGPHSLKLSVGDSVQNICEVNDWYFGCSIRNKGLRGIYPKSYIHIQEAYLDKTGAGELIIPSQPTIVQEINSVLREWGQIWKRIYVSRTSLSDRTLWHKIRNMMNELLRCRNTILSGTLTVDELKDLKQMVTSRIDLGNHLLGLDLLVRDEQGNLLSADVTSTIQLYRQHEIATKSIKSSAHNQVESKYVKSVVWHAHMLYLCVRNFVCRLTEDAELLMCLYDAKEGKPITESYVVRWSRSGLTQDLDQMGNLRVLYTDLGNKDLERESLYVVCYVVRVGSMDGRDAVDIKRGSSTPQKKVAAEHSVRRPFGVAAMDISSFVNGKLETDEDKQHFVPFLQCGDRESLETTLKRILNARDFGQREHKGQGLWCSLKVLHGDMKQVSDEHPSLVVGNVAIARKMGFPEVILPGDVRNDLYVTLACGELTRGSKSSEKNIEVTVKVCNSNGEAIPGVIYVGGGIGAQNEYRSVVYYHEDKPKWSETLKVAIPIEEFYQSHLRFTFRHRSSNDVKDRNEKVFAMSFVKLVQDNGTTLKDVQHELLVYKVDYRKWVETDKSYLTLPATRAEWQESNEKVKRIVPGLTMSNKESLTIATCVCSTKLTQNVDLLSLLQYWSSEDLQTSLLALMKVDGEEVVKFLQDVLDALFSILMKNPESNVYDGLVFECLVFIIGLVCDHKYEHFKPVLELYIQDNFSATLAYNKLLVVLKNYVDQATLNEGSDLLLKAMKSLQYLFKFIVRSRQLFAALYEGKQQEEFELCLEDFLHSLAVLMTHTTDTTLLVQGACLRFLPSTIPDILQVFDATRLSRILVQILNNLSPGRLTKQKMMTIDDIVHSDLFRLPQCRAVLLPVICYKVKELLSGKEETELSIKILSDIMEVLFHKDIGPTHKDITEVMMIVLRTVIQSVIAMDREDNLVGQLVAVMIAVFRQMTSNHYKDYLASFSTKSDLLDFLMEILLVFKDLVSRQVYPSDWADMILLENSVMLKALRYFSHVIRDAFSNPFEQQVWNNFFHCSIAFLTQPPLQLEQFSQAKRRKVISKYKDMRREMGFEIRSMWFNLGQHKISFVPAMVGPFLEMTLIPEAELRKATIPMFFDMMQCEFYAPKVNCENYSDGKRNSSIIKGNFVEVENTMIVQLDALVEGGRGDEHYKDLFHAILTELCENHSTLRDQGLKFVRTVTRLMERLLEYRSIITDENRENRMGCTVNLLDFYSEIGRQEMYIRYLNKLCDLHLECDNYTEAAFTLQLHAKLLQWSDAPLSPLLRTSKYNHCQTHRQLKQALYIESIVFFDKGKMWECALTLCKELAEQYEEETFDYVQLSALLIRMAGLYDNIMKQMRPEPEYFRVAFYGRGFPAFLQNKVYVFRGKEYEFLSDFSNRMLMQFPNAEIMKELTTPDKEIMDSPHQYLQINKVDPVMERWDKFAGKVVSEQILKFYRVNQVQKFSYSRPFHRGQRDSDNEFSTLCLERTVLETSYPLPGILRWFPVTKVEVFELCPIKTAIENMEAANQSLRDLILAHESDPNLQLSPLSMKLNGIVDAAVNGGISKYEKAFFTEKYLTQNSDNSHLVKRLQELFALQVPLLEAGLRLHRIRCSDAMVPLHMRIEECFQRMREHIQEKYGTLNDDPVLERQMAAIRQNQSSKAVQAVAENRLSTSSNPGDFNVVVSSDCMPNTPIPTSNFTSRPPTFTGLGTFSLAGLSQSLVNLSSGSRFSQHFASPQPTPTRNSQAPVFPTSPAKSAPMRQSSSSSLFTRHAPSYSSLAGSSVSLITPKKNKKRSGSLAVSSATSPLSPSPNSNVLKSRKEDLRRMSMSATRTSTVSSLTLSLGNGSTTSMEDSAKFGDINEAISPVIELSQQLTAKRPLRTDAIRDRRSLTLPRPPSAYSDASLGGGTSTPSRSTESLISQTSSVDDVPPPLPAKQSMVDYCNLNDHARVSESPILPAKRLTQTAASSPTFSSSSSISLRLPGSSVTSPISGVDIVLEGIEDDGPPPPPPPKKPVLRPPAKLPP